MNKGEFIKIAQFLTGEKEKWLDQMHVLTQISKPHLVSYGKGERDIPNVHALFLRHMYYLLKVYPDLYVDLNVLMRKPVTCDETLPNYKDISQKTALLGKIKSLEQQLRKIHRLSDIDKSNDD
ncbi:putative DNA-binding helix-turn-helix protein [Candidatus Terasakiella magnetica]|uniref:Putative DNA-binding helix-turn-helix protein n=2 Tax=Candidatus Terasakiella magnetica TaxID=1867952 RepID=A0A1C3RLJ6_9PROT|nr:putative DNA-binding helix-turn-helix protein [Candidatus Terasakiella magnetica]